MITPLNELNTYLEKISFSMNYPTNFHDDEKARRGFEALDLEQVLEKIENLIKVEKRQIKRAYKAGLKDDSLPFPKVLEVYNNKGATSDGYFTFNYEKT